jgi:hypothetical protein
MKFLSTLQCTQSPYPHLRWFISFAFQYSSVLISLFIFIYFYFFFVQNLIILEIIFIFAAIHDSISFFLLTFFYTSSSPRCFTAFASIFPFLLFYFYWFSLSLSLSFSDLLYNNNTFFSICAILLVIDAFASFWVDKEADRYFSAISSMI